MVKKKTNIRKDSIKIIGPKSIDYTFLDNDLLNLKSTIAHKIDEHHSNNVTLKRSKINKDIQRVHQVDLEIRKSSHKGRITGGQSKHSHSSVYE
jgi:hypothetical protein